MKKYVRKIAILVCGYLPFASVKVAAEGARLAEIENNRIEQLKVLANKRLSELASIEPQLLGERENILQGSSKITLESARESFVNRGGTDPDFETTILKLLEKGLIEYDGKEISGKPLSM